MQSDFKILVADDDSASRRLLINLLKKDGHAVTGVENGVEALEAFKTQFFNIVLTDWIMPRLDGIGLCQTIRKWTHLDRYVYVILLTAKNAHDDILLGLKAGADDYLVKPFYPSELMARLNTGIRIMNLEQARKEAETQIKKYSQNLEEMVLQRTEQLRTSEKKYHTILEEIEDGYYEMDLAGHVTFFNDSALEFSGYGKNELLGMHYHEFSHKESVEALFHAYHQVFKTGKPIKRLEWLMKTKSGQIRFMDGSVSLIRDSKGEASGFRGIIRDISAQKRLEGELTEKRRMAEAANQAKSEFLANMSHEIRTPLNGIIGMTELVLETRLEPDQEELLKIIESETFTLTELINHILDFSKIEAQKVDIEHVPFDLDHILDDLSRIMTLRTERKGLHFGATISSDVPKRILGDPGKLRQILMNLFTNALKFTHQGKIELHVKLEASNASQATLRFEVSDTGIGIAREKKDLIFDPFTQADGSMTRQYGGTGLGTTISKQLARLMGGDIGFESELEQGSTFWFTIKVGIDQTQEVCHLQQKGSLEDLRVLVAHAGTSAMADLLVHINALGCRVKSVAEGQDALNELARADNDQDPFSLMIIGNPASDLDGFALSCDIRNTKEPDEVPIILITATGGPGDAERCREIGINGYLTGDMDSISLKRAILMVMNQVHNHPSTIEKPLITRHILSEAQSRHIQILLVEDYPTNQRLAMRHLQNAGYAVDLAENGQVALQAFQKKRYDLILMDMQMPVMDGYTAIKHIRDLESKHGGSKKNRLATRHTPIIATTAHAMKGDRELCLAAGADDYISKPLRKSKLLNIVERWVMGGYQEECRRSVDNSDTKTPFLNEMKKEAIEHLPIDLKKAIDEFENDEPFFLDVLKSFLIALDGQIEVLRRAMEHNDCEVVRKEAHSIKGGAADLTAVPLSDLAYEIEKMGISRQLSDGLPLVARLDEAYRFLMKYVAQTHPEEFAALLKGGGGESGH